MIGSHRDVLLDVLKLAAERAVKVATLFEPICDKYEIPQQDRNERASHERGGKIMGYINQALMHLEQDGCLERREDFYWITERGEQELKNRSTQNSTSPNARKQNFDVTLLSAYEKIQEALRDELLRHVHDAPPEFLEHLMVKLMLAMGYGSEGRVIESRGIPGQSGDGGVDGVIELDPLGIEKLYFQAKRHRTGKAVSASSVRDFVGALDIKKVKKGVFVTTSSFSDNAVEAAKESSHSIVLVNGQKLSELMLEHGIGCTEAQVLSIKKIDEDFFNETE